MPLVIMHSFLGDESGYERLWKLTLNDRPIYALRHRFLAHSDAEAEAFLASVDPGSGMISREAFTNLCSS